MRLLLAPHRHGALRGRIPEPCFLHDPFAGVERVDLALNLVRDGLVHEPERVEVLDLRFRAERRRAGRTHRHVGVAAQAALLHVPVVDAKRDEQLAQVAEKRRRVFRCAQIRLGDDLDERRAGAVQIDVTPAIGIREAFVQQLAGVLLHVHARDADVVVGTPVVAAGPDQAVGRQRLLVLRNLVALGQIGIEVILAREDRGLVNGAAQGERRANGTIHRASVQHRQRPGQAEAHGTDVRVGLRAERGAAAAEDLGGGQQLRMDLEADDGLVLTHEVGEW